MSKKSLWALLIAVALVMGLVPTALADGDDSPAECTALAGNTSDSAITAPDGFVIDAICIKSGENSFGDLKHSGLITADGTYGDGFVVSGIGTANVTVTATGQHSVSHLDYRLVEEPDPEGSISVEKTADLTYDLEHFWDIDKSADLTELLLPADGSGDATVTWTVDVTYEGEQVSNAMVSGTIEITNDGDLDATIDSVDDVLDTGEASTDVDCGVTFPHVLAVGSDPLECTYSVDLAGDPADGTNTATVEGEFSDGSSFSESDDADFTDDGPLSETNATVNISDLSSYFGAQALGSVTAPNGDSFTYSENFTYEGVGGCEELVINNTANIYQTGQSASETVTIKTECIVFEGETATGEGDPWSEIGATKKERVNTWFEYSPLATTSFDIVTGKNLTDIGDFAVNDLLGPDTEICFTLDDPWLLADVAGNVKIEVLDAKPSAYIAPGQFDHHFTESGDAFCATVPDTGYGYAIHLDVGQWVSIGFGDLA